MKKSHGIILFILLALSTGLLWVFLTPEPVEEKRCRLKLKTNPDHSPIASLVTQWLFPLPYKPDEIKDVPSDIRRPSYYYLTVGGRRMPLAVNFSGTLRMRLDADGDGLLSDESCHLAHLVESRRESFTYRNKFGPLSLATGDGRNQATVSFNVLSYRRDRSGPLQVYPACYREGKMRIGDGIYKVALVDGDYDGRYNSVLSPPVDKMAAPQCDLLAIDLNGDGKFQPDMGSTCETMPLSKMILLGDTYYTIDVTPDGSRLELNEIQPEMGELALDVGGGNMALEVWSDAARQVLSCTPDSCKLPVARYQTRSATLQLKDSLRNNWAFSVRDKLGPLAFFEINVGETTRVRLGPPLLITAEIANPGTRNVTIRPVIIGCGGEEYEVAVQLNGRRLSAPTFRIVNQDGDVLVQDKFKYG